MNSSQVFAIILASYPLGVLMATYLPRADIGFSVGSKWIGFSLNPGPFSVKEQTLIIIAASTAIYPAYAIDILAIQRLYFGQNQDPLKPDPHGMNMGWTGGLLLLLTTQCIGFGLAGLFRNWLVYPAHMWWPVNLVISNLLHTFHGKETSFITQKRLGLFKWVVLGITIYQFFPGFIAPVLQSVAFLCLAAGGPSGKLGNQALFPKTASPVDPRPMISQMGSGLRGGGILSLSLSWESIGSLSPMYTPLWAQLNYLFANYAFTWLIIPLLFKSNFWNAQLYPMYSTEAFTTNGTYYNITQVLAPDSFSVDPQKYEDYSPLRLSPFWALTYGCSFATITATITHVLLFHGAEIWKNFNSHSPDIHTRMMQKYREVPYGWYLMLLFSMLGLGMFTVEHWYNELQLKVRLSHLYLLMLYSGGVFYRPSQSDPFSFFRLA